MNITISLRISALDHESWSSFTDEVHRLLLRVPTKIESILDRPPNCLCTSPEDDDLLRDSFGRPVGTITITLDPPPPETPHV